MNRSVYFAGIALLGGAALTVMAPFPSADALQNAPEAPATTMPENFPVTITIDAGKSIGPLKPIYRFFGADEPNYATMHDGKILMGDIGSLGEAQAYFRTHNLLCTGDGTAAVKWGSTNIYTEDAQGKPIYNFKIVDEIFDTYLANHVKPYAQIGFMPEAMSTHPEPYQHHWKPGMPYGDISTGWSYPPKDYDKWRELVYQWVKHDVDRYGAAEVEKWYWEVWNEANSNGTYWHGSPADFRKLHDYAIDGVKKALPNAKVGGADTAGAGGQWMKDFLEHCLRGKNEATGGTGTPIDFISFHAKGSPTLYQGHVRMGISNQLRTMSDGFNIVASFPELKDKPIIMGESDPDGCAACAATEYPANAYRNTSQFASYTAATFGRELELADLRGVNLEGAITWAFEFENEPIFAGFRVMSTTGGVNLPVFNVFRMLGKMSGQRVAVSSDGAIPMDQIMRAGVRQKPDVSALAALDQNRLCIFTWHYHDDAIEGPSAAVSLAVKNLPSDAPVKMQQYWIDTEHSNAFTAWQQMGSPAQPTEEQIKQLRAKGMLESVGGDQAVTVKDKSAEVKLSLPRQSVALVVLSW